MREHSTGRHICLGLLGATGQHRRTPLTYSCLPCWLQSPRNLSVYYTAWPQPVSTLAYASGFFACEVRALLRKGRRACTAQPGALRKYGAGCGVHLNSLPAAPFTWQGPYAICAFAACTPLADSDPPVAECGCYAQEGPTLGFSPGVLKKNVRLTGDRSCRRRGRSAGWLGAVLLRADM